MKFNRSELNNSASSLATAADVEERCIGCNYLIEENVAEVRRDDVETYAPDSASVRYVVKEYFLDSVQGLSRGHFSSTFDERVNPLALLPVTIEPNQKIVRIERIDRLMESRDASGELRKIIDYPRLVNALARRDEHDLSLLTDRFLDFSGERPSFAAFKSEVSEDLKQTDWLERIIDRLGLYHHYPFIEGDRYRFALMEYTAEEVIKQARTRGIAASFALATVLECQDNPAFFPVPRSTSHGFTVDLRERNPRKPTVREILHIRFDYSWRHVTRLAEWSGAALPDIEAARGRHLDTLRTETGRTDFGEVGI